MTMPDPRHDPDWKAWAAHVADDVVPKISESLCTVTLVPGDGEADIKFAVELGLSIMLDKPIIAVETTPGSCPAGLRRIAHAVIVGEPGDQGFDDRLQAALRDLPGWGT